MADNVGRVFEQSQAPRETASRENHFDAALREIYDGHVEYLREVVGLPRLSLMYFLGELHRLRPRDEDD